MSILMSENQSFQVIKGDIPIRKLLKSNSFNFELSKSLSGYNNGLGFGAIGHARLVTTSV